MKATKIICTIGPATGNTGGIAGLIQAGMDVARLNYSHGSKESHGEMISIIRGEAERLKCTVAILQDLPGPKIRTGTLPEGGVVLKPGQDFTLTVRDIPGSAAITSVSYPDLPRDVRAGDRILIADGNLELETVKISGKDILCKVIIGGLLTSHKGINVPTNSISAPAMTPQDEDLMRSGLSHGVDMVALSFVKTGEDIWKAKKLAADCGRPDVPIIAKIERHEALEFFHEILAAADGIMVARGDLGVEIPLEQVPMVQKDIITKANAAGKPVIVATQMLRSMVTSNRPSRAEATDVANAVLDGADAVMLSEETAIGEYPLEAAAFLSRIAVETEAHFPHERYLQLRISTWDTTTSVAQAACALAANLKARAIVAFTQSGTTAMQISRFRPKQPVVALSPDPDVLRRLALFWNVAPCCVVDHTSTDGMMDAAVQAAQTMNLAAPGDTIIVTAGVPLLHRGFTNMIRVVNL